MQEITAMAQTYRTERDIWAESYKDLSDKATAHAAEQRENLAALRAQIENERSAWKGELRKAKSPGFGIFAGVGYTGSGVEAVVGVGVVWRLF
jgi:RNA polymerase-binding transcription factor DksA